ncbi:putative Ubiquitin carboxyl-terminal hydrolase 4 [Cardiosporidium cionae]|uniref:ubiquitinyl hydrolase 1 n=1 Tax=Cardiosporidium cionae TaxID=476202 RepID=A0ABQ7JBV6_9APIC|nr:putative Ubiquitin carboxyl-terminal hydrolase 4 [Cardiosporidium cionae]|eukprot:KAF8821433.1 putative Ubiquitin carboxyl-terminal hydrolase 4 [Cardiosporidium cionae]
MKCLVVSSGNLIGVSQSLSSDPALESANSDDGLLQELGDLFWQMKPDSSNRGAIAPKRFIQKLRYEIEMYRDHEQQDAHEFFIVLVNSIVEDLRRLSISTFYPVEIEPARLMQLENYVSSEELLPVKEKTETWIHDFFQGTFEYETFCLCCESTTRRLESFLDLSIDILDGCSLSGCIKKFSSKELLNGSEKYFCQSCASHQEALRSVRIVKMPLLLTIHLKRFKFVETECGALYKRLPYRILLPLELRLTHLILDHSLCRSMSRGHYVSCIKSDSGWLLYDDQTVENMSDKQLQTFFGGITENCGVNSGYLLFYQLVGD